MYNRKLKETQEETAKTPRAQEKVREDLEKQRDLYWNPLRPTKQKTPVIEPPPKTKRKADVFQRVFQGIVRVVREMWLERNTDRYNPLQGQKRIAKITEATRTVTELYSLCSLIMPEHESKYFVMPLEEMLQQSAPKMLSWVTRWKIGIYQSVCRAKMISKQMTVPIWKIWEPEQTNEPVKKVDKRRITASRKRTKKYKTTAIMNKLKVKERIRSTSLVTKYVEGKTYLQATFDNLEAVVMEKNDALYGDAGND